MTLRFNATMRDSWTSIDHDVWSFTLPTGWMQGRSVYGGLTTAAATALALKQAPSGYVLRSVHTQFLRPAQPGTLQGRTREVRRGKNTAFWEVTLLQEGDEVLRAQLIFGRSRDKAVQVTPPLIQFEQSVDSVESFPYIPGLMPEFLQNMEMRWAEGGYPYSGATHAALAGYCRHRQPSGSYEGILGLLDAWPCPTLTLLSTPSPASTIAWTAHLLAVPESLEGWFRFRYETVVGGEGFHRCVGRLADSEGHLIAWSEQLVAVYG
ncbi:MAG: thioesterase family protein [Myxococcota bacterium]